jgi:hypothetical protein
MSFAACRRMMRMQGGYPTPSFHPKEARKTTEERGNEGNLDILDSERHDGTIYAYIKTSECR